MRLFLIPICSLIISSTAFAGIFYGPKAELLRQNNMILHSINNQANYSRGVTDALLSERRRESQKPQAPEQKQPIIIQVPRQEPYVPPYTVQPNQGPVYSVQPNQGPVYSVQPNRGPVYQVQPNRGPVYRTTPNQGQVYTVPPVGGGDYSVPDLGGSAPKREPEVPEPNGGGLTVPPPSPSPGGLTVPPVGESAFYYISF